MTKNPHAVALGKKSALIGKRNKNSQFGRDLVQKRWDKVKNEAKVEDAFIASDSHNPDNSRLD